MTNRLELNWSLDGFVDEQRYYCSETPIDSENLPVPKVILDGEARSYIDTDVEVGKTYYVRVGSVKNNVEKLSDEIMISTTLERLLVHLPLTSDLTDFGSLGVIWKNNGNVTFGNDGAYFSSYPQSIFQDSHAFDFNSDYRISFDLMRTSANNTAPSIFNNDETGVFPLGRFSASVGGDNIFAEFRNKWLIGVSGYYDIASDSTVQNDTVYAYSIERRAGVVTVSVNDFVVLSRNETAVISMTTFLNIGRMPVHGQGGQFIGYIRNFKIYDLS